MPVGAASERRGHGGEISPDHARPLPGPAPTTLPLAPPVKNPTRPGTGAITRRRAGGVNVERPTGPNDVDADKRRHTLEGFPDPYPLTNYFFIEGAMSGR